MGVPQGVEQVRCSILAAFCSSTFEQPMSPSLATPFCMMKMLADFTSLGQRKEKEKEKKRKKVTGTIGVSGCLGCGGGKWTCNVHPPTIQQMTYKDSSGQQRTRDQRDAKLTAVIPVHKAATVHVGECLQNVVCPNKHCCFCEWVSEPRSLGQKACKVPFCSIFHHEANIASTSRHFFITVLQVRGESVKRKKKRGKKKKKKKKEVSQKVGVRGRSDVVWVKKNAFAFAFETPHLMM